MGLTGGFGRFLRTIIEPWRRTGNAGRPESRLRAMKVAWFGGEDSASRPSCPSRSPIGVGHAAVTLVDAETVLSALTVISPLASIVTS